MNLLPTAEQQELANAAATLLAKEVAFTPAEAEQGVSAVLRPDAWRAFATQGWFALGVPEAAGGVGYGAGEEALLFIELGRHLAPGPFLATVLAVHALAASPHAATRDGLVDGSIRAAQAEVGPDGTLLVAHGKGADVVVVVDPDGPTVHDAASLTGRGPATSIDPLTPLEWAERPTGEPLARMPAASLGWERALVLTAAMQVGIALATRDQSVAHVGARHQFGRPLASFQAVRHRCSDMAVRSEAAQAQTLFASLRVADGGGDAPFQALCAAVVARDSAARNGADNIQNHGAMGFTAEHSAHLYVKRARFLGATLGGRSGQLDRLASLPAPAL